jgi:hypothetical protein
MAANPMTPFLHRLFRGTVLGLMFLLAGTANLVCVSYDADDNDDTPPISIELSILAPCKKGIQVAAPHAHSQAFRLQDEKPVISQVSSAIFATPTLLEQKSPQLLVPLRT